MLRFALAALAVTTLLSAPRTQAPQPGVTMLATERYLFVLRGNDLFQFEIDTLKPLNRAELPAAAAPVRPDDLAEPVTKPPVVVEEPVIEETETIEEAEEAPPGAGGRYGGRGEGHAALARKGGAATAEAIASALRWLATHQDADGRWNADEFMKNEKGGEPSDGPGTPVHDVGLTGLALLAFLGDGSTMRSGPHRDVIKRGVNWLREQQDPNTGLFGTNNSNEFIYDHAIATWAMTEAYGLSQYKLLKSTAQKAIDYLEFHRNPYAVWRYQPRDGDNDTSVTAWCVMAYCAARDFKLEVNTQALKLAAVWLDQMTDPVSGRTGYTERGGFSSRRAGDHAVRFPRENNEAMTAAALFCRFLLGQSPETDKIMTTQADLILKKPPVWEAGHVDECAWMFGTLAMYQIGGRHWRDWQKHLAGAIVETQRNDDNFAGSWDPAGVWGEDGGRIYSTALQCLTLETYYRYTRLVR